MFVYTNIDRGSKKTDGRSRPILRNCRVYCSAEKTKFGELRIEAEWSIEENNKGPDKRK